MLHRIRSWYTGRWWVGCYIWYSEEGPGWAASPLLAAPNVTAHPSTASVPITVLQYDGPLLCGLNVAIKGLKWSLATFTEPSNTTVVTCISFEVFWRYHHNESDGTFVLEHLVRPSTDRADTLDSRYAVVCDQHLSLTEVFQRIIQSQSNNNYNNNVTTSPRRTSFCQNWFKPV